MKRASSTRHMRSSKNDSQSTMGILFVTSSASNNNSQSITLNRLPIQSLECHRDILTTPIDTNTRMRRSLGPTFLPVATYLTSSPGGPYKDISQAACFWFHTKVTSASVHSYTARRPHDFRAVGPSPPSHRIRPAYYHTPLALPRVRKAGSHSAAETEAPSDSTLLVADLPPRAG